MKGLLVLGVVLFGVFAIWFFDDTTRASRESAYWRQVERQSLQLEQERQRAELQMQIDAFAVPVMNTTLLVVAVGLAVAVPVGIGIASVSIFRRRVMLVYPDADGRVPLRLDDVAYQGIAAAALGAFHQVQHERARQSYAVPLHYAPTISYEPRYTNSPQVAAAAVSPEQPVELAVPTFAQLLDAGRIGRGNPLLLGIDDSGNEVIGSWLDLYSTAVAGLPGTGKTTSQRFLAAQTALFGTRFVVVDPHYGAADDSLGATLLPLLQAVGLCEVASSDQAVLEAVRMVADIGRRRVKGDRERTPVILWIDEGTALLNRSTVGPGLAELLEAISQEYRKVGVYASISGQIWTAERAGGSALRDSLASCLVHRMKRSQARLLVSSEAARLVEGLQVGRALLYRTSGQLDTLAIPNTTAADVRRVAGLLTDNQPTMERVSVSESVIDQPSVSHTEPLDYSPLQSQIVTTPEQARTVALFLDGLDAGAIVTELTGMTSKAGKPYMLKLTEVQSTIREAMRQGVQR